MILFFCHHSFEFGELIFWKRDQQCLCFYLHNESSSVIWLYKINIETWKQKSFYFVCAVGIFIKCLKVFEPGIIGCPRCNDSYSKL